MKKIALSILTLFFGIVLFNSCEKDADLRMPEIPKGALAYITVLENTGTNLNSFALDQYSGGFTVSKKYGDIQSVDIMLAFNNNFASAFTFKTVSSLPSNVNFTAAELAAAVGTTVAVLKPGDTFFFYTKTKTTDGKVLSTFRADGSRNYNSSMENEPDASIWLNYAVICGFDINNFLGAYDCDEAGYAIYPMNFTLDPSVANRIHNDNFWDWAAAGATVYYDLSGDDAQTVTVPDQPFTFGDGVVGSVSGSGSYDACTGAMTLHYDVIYDGSTYPTDHVFTPAAEGKKSTVSSKKDFLKSNCNN